MERSEGEIWLVFCETCGDSGLLSPHEQVGMQALLSAGCSNCRIVCALQATTCDLWQGQEIIMRAPEQQAARSR
jgi:hypothetical protein